MDDTSISHHYNWIIRDFERITPFCRLLNIQIVQMDETASIFEMPLEDKHCSFLNILHGGSVFSLMDTAIAGAFYPLLVEHEIVTMTELKINFIRSATPADVKLVAHGKVLSLGKRMGVGEGEVFTAAGQLVAKALGTVARAKKRP